MAGETFLFRKLKGRQAGPDVIVPKGLMREAVVPQSVPSYEEMRENARKAAYDAILAQRSFSKEEVAASQKYLADHPDVIQNLAASLRPRLQENPGSVLAQIDKDLREILAVQDPTDVQKIRDTNMLVPLVFAEQARQREAANEQLGDAMQTHKAGKMNEPYYGRMVLATGGAFALTATSAVIDAMFGKQGITAGLEIASEKMGSGAFEWLGSEIQWISNYLVETNGTGNGAQKVAVGINATAIGILSGSLIYAGKVKTQIDKLSDMVRGGARPILMPAILAGFIALGMAAQKKNAIEGAESQEVAAQLDRDLTSVSDKVQEALRKIHAIKPVFQKGIQDRYEAAFKKGGDGFGSETAITQLALKGDSAKELQEKFDTFLVESGKKPGNAAEKEKRIKGHLDRLKKAREKMSEINAKYRDQVPALKSLKPTDGAEKVLELLTADIATKGGNFDSLFTSLLSVAKEKAAAGIFSNIFGKLEFWRANPSFSGMLKMEQRYHEDFMVIEEQIKMLLLTQYLDEVSKETGVDLRIKVTPPSMGITSTDLARFKLNPEKYKHITAPSAIAFVNPVPNAAEWEAIAKSVAKSGIPNSLEKPEAWFQRSLFIGGTAAAFLFFLAGSLAASISANRFWERRRGIDLTSDDAILKEKEKGVVDTVFGYLNAYKQQFLGFLGTPDNGADVPEALRARVQTRLRELAFDEAKSGISLSMQGVRRKELEESMNDADRADFLSGTRPLPSKEFRNAYAASLNALSDRIASNPETEIPKLLADINGELVGVVAAMNEALTIGQSSSAYEQAVQKMRDAYARFEAESLKQQGEELVSMVENLYARKQALEEIAVSEGSDADIILGEGVPPKITAFTLIRSYMLAEIDTEILGRHALIEDLRSRSVTVRDPNQFVQKLPQPEWDALREKFFEQETGMMFGTTSAAEAATKVNEYLTSLDPFLQQQKRDIDAIIARNGFQGTTRFEHSYNPTQSVRGPTVHLELMSDDGSIITSIPYKDILPNPEGDSTKDSQTALGAWLAPDGPAVQKLQIWSAFERTRNRVKELERNLESSGGPNLEFAYGNGFVDTARMIDEYLIWSEYQTEQNKKVKVLDTGGTLAQQDIQLFLEPEKQTIVGGWRYGRTQATLERMEQEKTRAHKNSVSLVVRAIAGSGRRPEVIVIPTGSPIPITDTDIIARTPLVRGQIDFNRLP